MKLFYTRTHKHRELEGHGGERFPYVNLFGALVYLT